VPINGLTEFKRSAYWPALKIVVRLRSRVTGNLIIIDGLIAVIKVKISAVKRKAAQYLAAFL
jgi:hypothetical protein